MEGLLRQDFKPYVSRLCGSNLDFGSINTSTKKMIFGPTICSSFTCFSLAILIVNIKNIWPTRRDAPWRLNR